MITYNNKDILKFFIGNNRIVKKYLNNKVVYGTPDFAQYYLIDHKDNYDIVGDTIIQNNIANNFSVGEEGNHLKINNFSTTWSFSTLELNTKFRFTNISEYNNSYLLGTSHSTPFNRFGFSVQNYSQEQVNITPMVYLVNPDNGKYFSISGPQFPLIYKNTWYILNLITNGTDMELSLLSEDGTLLRKQSTPFGTPTNKCYSFDIIGNTNVDIDGVDWAGYFHGDIDLSETYIKVNDRYMFNGNQNYKELLDCNPNIYLQSSGTQYIDTNISGVVSTELDAKGVLDNLVSQVVLGRYSSGPNFFGQFGTSKKWGVGSDWLSNLSYMNRGKFLVNFNSKGISFTYNGITYNRSTGSAQPNRNIFIFACNDTSKYYANVNVYSLKIYNSNNELIRNFVPVPEGLQIGSYKVPSNGMFDIVTQTFFENKGSGEFIWGVDL